MTDKVREGKKRDLYMFVRFLLNFNREIQINSTQSRCFRKRHMKLFSYTKVNM